MNAPAKIEPENVYKRLNRARAMFHQTKLRKTGKNTFAGYSYFELGDFLVPALRIFEECGLCAIISFSEQRAFMDIRNVDNPGEFIEISSPMGSAALKGCHEVQNIGAVETYQRRYLWVTALEIVEHDALDATTGRDAQGQSEEREVNSAQPVKRISNDQIARLEALIPAAKLTPAQFCQTMNCKTVAALPADKFEEAMERLNARLAKLVKEETNAKAKEAA